MKFFLSTVQAVFDAMNHFDELAIVERANPYRKDGR